MQHLFFGGVTRQQSQHKLTSIALAISIFVVCFQNMWSGIYLQPIINFDMTNSYMQTKNETVTQKQPSPVGLTGLGAMGESETLQDIEPIDLKNKLNIEEKLENDIACKSVLDDRRYKVLEYEKEINLEKEKLLKQKQFESIVCDNTDITKISNMTQEQIGIVLKGTWLEGEEETLYTVEHEAGINAFFIYAVATLESGHGESTKSITKNNYYGITVSRSFESYSHNTEYFGGMMNRVYVEKGHIDVDNIGKIYCPPNPDWGTIVSQIMSDQYEKMMDLTVA